MLLGHPTLLKWGTRAQRLVLVPTNWRVMKQKKTVKNGTPLMASKLLNLFLGGAVVWALLSRCDGDSVASTIGYIALVVLVGRSMLPIAKG